MSLAALATIWRVDSPVLSPDQDQALVPVAGVDQVIRFFGTLRRHFPVRAVRTIDANGQAAALLWFGRQHMLFALDVRDGKIREIHSILNPDKLSYLQRQLTETHSG
jgi:RNA polymerase sigma-70 factor (ECF subfamily)